jgi:hypothetical protein
MVRTHNVSPTAVRSTNRHAGKSPLQFIAWATSLACRKSDLAGSRMEQLERCHRPSRLQRVPWHDHNQWKNICCDALSCTVTYGAMRPFADSVARQAGRNA